MRLDEEKLKAFLLDTGLVTRRTLADAETKASQKKNKLSDVLVSEGILPEDDMRRASARLSGITFVDLKEYQFVPDVLSLIPEPIARRHNVVAYKQTPRGLEVALLDTDALSAVDFVRSHIGMPLLPRLTDTASLRRALRTYQQILKERYGDAIADAAKVLATISHQTAREQAEHPATIRLLDTLFRHALAQHASAVHFVPLEEESVVRYRLDGILTDAMTLPKNASALVSRLRTLAGLSPESSGVSEEGRFRIERDGETVTVRLVTLPTRTGEQVIMRLTHAPATGLSLEGLGLHGRGLEEVHEALRRRKGLFVVSGSSGSGVTTLLYTLLDVLNTPAVSIGTLENAIEHQLPRVAQIPVGAESGVTGEAGMRSLLRADTDIIMIDDLSDSALATLALQAVERGILVLVGVRAASAAQALRRLMTLGVSSEALADGLSLVVSTALVRQPETTQKSPLSKKERTGLSRSLDFEKVLAVLRDEGYVTKDADWDTLPVHRSAEKKTGGFAPAGRPRGIHEVLPVSPQIKTLIATSARARDIDKQAREEGMLSFKEEILFRAVVGDMGFESVQRL